jgi:signal transduction histidine kinase
MTNETDHRLRFPTANHETTSYRFLIVEDNPGDYFLVKKLLELSGLSIETIAHAANMSQARTLINQQEFDIALLDLSLPDSSGTDSVMTIDELLPETPTVVLSGSGTIEKAMEAIAVGAQDYLVKGEFDERLLVKTIQYSVERKRRIVHLAKERLRQQKLITEVTLQVQEKEKNELGRELHDNITQLLATAKMYLGILRSGNAQLPEELLEKSHEYVVTAIEELRKLSHSLATPTLGDKSLSKVLQDLVDDINSSHKLQIALKIDGNVDALTDKGKELMLYRILQEQINNILKYAQATKVVVSLSIQNGILKFVIADNGIGFNADEKSEGIGLKNIRSRVDFYNGVTEIISSPGNGCRLEVSVVA